MATTDSLALLKTTAFLSTPPKEGGMVVMGSEMVEGGDGWWKMVMGSEIVREIILKNVMLENGEVNE